MIIAVDVAPDLMPTEPLAEDRRLAFARLQREVDRIRFGRPGGLIDRIVEREARSARRERSVSIRRLEGVDHGLSPTAASAEVLHEASAAARTSTSCGAVNVGLWSTRPTAAQRGAP